MEKQNIYPEMPPLPGKPDGPPTYDQTYPTAPSAETNPMMPIPSSSGAGPMAMQPQPQQFLGQQQPILMVQTGLQAMPPLGPAPCLITCPSCHQQQMSDVRMVSTTKTHLFALILCVVGLCCCACIPYCVDTCKNANHYCRNCRAYLGTYNK